MRKFFRINLDQETDKFNINPILKIWNEADKLLTEMLTKLQQAILEKVLEMKNCPSHLIIEWMDQTQGAIPSMTELTWSTVSTFQMIKREVEQLNLENNRVLFHQIKI